VAAAMAIAGEHVDVGGQVPVAPTAPAAPLSADGADG